MKKKATPKKAAKKAVASKVTKTTKATPPPRKKAAAKTATTKVARAKKDASDTLLEEVIKGIQEKKGENIVSLNLKKINGAVCNYFVICEANSSTQVSAIADSVEETVKKNTGQRPYHKEGRTNAEWILIDYADVVVHVFQRSIRSFYRLEELWADAEIKQYA